MKRIIITIDGPAASGKEKIAKYISKKWNLKHLDSGILYRKIAYLLLKKNINYKSINQIKMIIAQEREISYRNSKVLRKEQISKIASQIAVYKFVRNHVNNLQKKFVRKNIKKTGFVIDGRDIGSVVFKNANLKLYIDVNEENRAERRYKQLIDAGEKSIYQKILKEIKLRDKTDKTRKLSPLVIPNGAHIINNNHSFYKTTKQINNIMKNL